MKVLQEVGGRACLSRGPLCERSEGLWLGPPRQVGGNRFPGSGIASEVCAHIFDPFYRARVGTFLLRRNIEECNARRLATFFAEFGPAIREMARTHSSPSDATLFIARAVTILEERMKVNAVKCEERLRGLKWISQEPGRQWTSSIRPIRERPVDFYGVRFYTPFQIGMPVEVESTIRLIWHSGHLNPIVGDKKMTTLNPGNAISTVPRDVLNLLLKYVMRAYVYNPQMRQAAVQTVIPGMVPPGFNSPRFSACSMIYAPTRSLTEPPGFMNSSFA